MRFAYLQGTRETIVVVQQYLKRDAQGLRDATRINLTLHTAGLLEGKLEPNGCFN